MGKPRVVVFEYGSGNVHSAAKAMELAGADVTLTKDRSAALAADGLLVPGVGAYARVMQLLRAARGDEIIDLRLAGGRPVLGICVGLQVMFEDGVEGGERTEGLGQWPGTVRRIESPKLPHVGWNTIEASADSKLFAGVENEYFYFTHSYAAPDLVLDVAGRTEHPKVTYADYGERFVAAVENGPLTATQFHPEKSGDAGAQLLRNWIASM